MKINQSIKLEFLIVLFYILLFPVTVELENIRAHSDNALSAPGYCIVLVKSSNFTLH
jgi:hypothetical protein